MGVKMKSLVLFISIFHLIYSLNQGDTNVDVDENDYDGYKVFKTFPLDDDLPFIRSYQEKEYGVYDIWSEIRTGTPIDIMVAPKAQEAFTSELTEKGIKYQVMIENVQDLINLEKIESAQIKRVSADHPMTWTEYHTLEDMYAYLDYLEATYDFVSTESVGKSYEGTEMRVVKVCRGGCGDKPAAWIDGGIHAREWVSPATVTWMLMELVENDANHADLTQNLDWYILPSHNPDGYAYSRDHKRLWRKTRSDHGSILLCKGVDANRNWGFHWNEGGSSGDKCSDTYHGPEAFSEVENRNVRDFILTIKDKLVFYNTLHSYSQLILLPWSYTDTPPDNYAELLEIATLGADSLHDTHGKTYEVGCIPCILYVASGGSLDWVMGEAGVQFSMAMELRDTGTYGFLLPASQIIPTAEETWAFHVTVIREIFNRLP